MSLNVTVSNVNDYGRYFCVSKNEMGITRGSINVFGQCARVSVGFAYFIL